MATVAKTARPYVAAAGPSAAVTAAAHPSITARTRPTQMSTYSRRTRSANVARNGARSAAHAIRAAVTTPTAVTPPRRNATTPSATMKALSPAHIAANEIWARRSGRATARLSQSAARDGHRLGLCAAARAARRSPARASARDAAARLQKSGISKRRGANRAEEAVALVVGAGGEEQRVRRAVVGGAVAELQRPQAVDGKRAVIGAAQSVLALVAAVGRLGVGVDAPVAEV